MAESQRPTGPAHAVQVGSNPSRAGGLARQLPRWHDLAPLLRPSGGPWRPSARRLARTADVEDLRRMARRRTPRPVFDYVDGGAGDEVSMARAIDAFRRVELIPRVLRDVRTVDTSTTILGQPAALPLVFAPTGFTRMMHAAGEAAVARAAARAGIPYALSTVGTTTPEDLAATCPDGRRWFQLYVWRDRDSSRALLERAIAAGFDTLVLTVDVPVGGARLRDVRAGLTVPPTLTGRTFVQGLLHPAWLFDFLTTERLTFASLATDDSVSMASLANRMFDPSVTFDDLPWFRDTWQGPLVVKGVQSVDDARRLADLGVDGIVVSNHGGRQLDRSTTPLELLPHIAAAVGDRLEVMMDGGVRSGADVVAAVALGARAVLVGRAYLYGLMAAGEAGVDRVAALLRNDVVRTMQLMGVTRVSELTSELVRVRDAPPQR